MKSGNQEFRISRNLEFRKSGNNGPLGPPGDQIGPNGPVVKRRGTIIQYALVWYAMIGATLYYALYCNALHHTTLYHAILCKTILFVCCSLHPKMHSTMLHYAKLYSFCAVLYQNIL